MKKIIGNGLIARKFSSLEFCSDCLILASGVSNSGETRASEFKREFDLVRQSISKNKSLPVVYFSTCSIYQQQQSDYIRHKLAVEALIAEEAVGFYIYRLPQVVGVVHNSTLFSYLVDAVMKGQVVKVQRFAQRNLIDIRDVSRLAHYLVENAIGRDSIQNIAAEQSVYVLDILQHMSRVLGKTALFEMVDSGESYQFSVNFLKEHFAATDPVFGKDYWRDVISYYALLLSKSNVDG